MSTSEEMELHHNHGRPGVPDRRIVEAQADMTSCENIRRLFIAGRRAIRAGPASLSIDMRRVDLADTKLIACLVVLYQIARSWNVPLALHPSAPVLEVGSMCRLDWWIARLAGRGEAPR